MPNNLTKTPTNLPANYAEEADSLLSATEGHDKLLKFIKGRYKVGDDEVPLGTQYVVHANQLTYCWIKFVDKKVAERLQGKAIERWVPPSREELDDKDQSKWETGLDGKPKDPWSFQHLLPFENLESGDVAIFTTGSVGGEIATEELVNAYARRLKRKGTRALPIVKLSWRPMPTRAYGEVPRPYFEITDWDDYEASGVEVVPPNAPSDHDHIPF